MYAQDYDEKLCFAEMMTPVPMRNWYCQFYYPNGTTTQNLLYWMDLTHPYVKNYQIVECPSEPTHWTGYSWNIHVGYCGNHPTRTGYIYEGYPLAKIPYPAETLVLLDHSNIGRVNPTYSSPWYYNFIGWPGSVYDQPACWQPAVHNGGQNVLLADGHAKWFRYPQFRDPSVGGSVRWTP